MAPKRFKSNAINEIIDREENINFVNHSPRKIELKSCIRYLHKKDENSNIELESSQSFVDISDSDIPLLNHIHSSSSSDDEKQVLNKTILKNAKR